MSATASPIPRSRAATWMYLQGLWLLYTRPESVVSGESRLYGHTACKSVLHQIARCKAVLLARDNVLQLYIASIALRVFGRNTSAADGRSSFRCARHDDISADSSGGKLLLSGRRYPYATLQHSRRSDEYYNLAAPQHAARRSGFAVFCTTLKEMQTQG